MPPATAALERCLPRCIERHARERAAAVALLHDGIELSYAALNERANRIAHELIARGAGAGTRVGLCLPRGPDLIAALLGILKSGAAYVPLDPEYPPPRLQRILLQAAPALLVTETFLLDRLRTDVPALCLAHEAASIEARTGADPGRPITPAQPCYVIFTSGTTGEPKGVVVTHGNVARLFDDIGPRLALDAADTWSQLHSCAFGFSVFEIWGALTHGARLALAPAAARADGLLLREFLERSGTTVLALTPTAWRETVLAGAFDGAWPALPVRALVLSGEAVQARDLEQWSARYARGGPRLVNTYAITETGGNVMFREYAPGDCAARNIGVPLHDVVLHVLDGGRQPVAPGEAGELYIGGPGIAAGYLNDPALTEARFVALGVPPARAYRTGDRVRITAAGSVEFLGRLDEQVKWRGHRLELGEIEALLRAHPGVSAAAAAIQPDAAGDEKLVVYVVPGGQAPAGEAEFWPSLGGYQIYDAFLYDLMSEDALREAAFRAAFARCARDRVVLDLGTGPRAWLARLAAEAGARRVYAVEVLPEAARRARAAVAEAGLAARIEVIEADALALRLPEPAEVCTQGIIGNIGSADGIAAIWNRVRAQLAPGCVPVPARCTTWFAPVELPESLRATPAFAPLAREYVEKIFRAEGRVFDPRLCVRNLDPAQLLAAPRVFEDLDFTALLPEQGTGSGHFVLQRAGRIDGFLLWTVVGVDAGASLDYLAHQHAWLPVFVPLPEEGVAFAAGTRVDAEWRWAPGPGGLCPDYTVRARIAGGEPIEAVTRHHETRRGASAIHRRLHALREAPAPGVAPGELRAWLARHLPEPLLPNAWMYLPSLPVSPNGKLDRRALPPPGPRTWGGQGGAPRSALESDLAALWSEILGVAAVGLQDNFFDLGGDSIAAVRLTTRVQQLIDDAVMLAAVFEAPTIGAYARYLAEHHRAATEAHYGPARPGMSGRSARADPRRKHGEL